MRAGLILRKRDAGRAWWGDVRLESRNATVRVAALVAANSPAYTAGLEQDDELRLMDGERMRSAGDVDAVLRRHKPGDRVQITFVDRTGVPKTAAVTLAEDPHLDVVPIEYAGGALTSAQRVFRDRWLGPK